MNRGNGERITSSWLVLTDNLFQHFSGPTGILSLEVWEEDQTMDSMSVYDRYGSSSSFGRTREADRPRLVYENLAGYVEQNPDGSYTSYDSFNGTSQTWTPPSRQQLEQNCRR